MFGRHVFVGIGRGVAPMLSAVWWQVSLVPLGGVAFTAVRVCGPLRCWDPFLAVARCPLGVVVLASSLAIEHLIFRAQL